MKNIELETKWEMAPAIAVETRSLTIRRGNKLLFEQMSWRLPAGKFLAVTGASGAGKSSLLACLSGSAEPETGTFKLSIADSKSLGLVFQNFRLTMNLNVFTNVLCGKLGNYAWWQTLFSYREGDRRAALAILHELGLEKLIYRPVKKISGGEQQRCAVARVLLQDPQIIFADEPTSNLDQESAKRVLGRLRRLCTEKNRSVVCVLHDAHYVDDFADYELKIGAEYQNGWLWRENER